MTIVRGAQPTDNFAILSNAMLQDPTLSFRARGVLASILSRPPGWSTNSSLLAEQGAEGRDAIRTVLAELEGKGYLRRTKERNAEGQFISITEVSMTPTLEPVPTSDPAPENPALDNQAVTTKTDHKDRSSSPSVSPEATVEEKISDDEVTVEAQAPASPPEKPKGSTLSRGEVVAPPARLDLLPEHYEHRRFMPDKDAYDEIRERFAGHDGSDEGFKLTLRGQTNSYIKWMEERKKAPHSRGWRDWMVRYYRRIIEQNLKVLGITMSDYSPSELTQEEREAMANEVRNAADQMEGGTDDPGR